MNWQVMHVTKALYRLRNIGAHDATDVSVKGLPTASAGLVKFPSGVTAIAAGEAVDFNIMSVMQAPDVNSIEVTWNGGQREVVAV